MRRTVGRFLIALALAGADQARAIPDDPAGATVDLTATLSQCQELARHHRFDRVLELLEPIAGEDLEPEARYALTVELGRAHFHLGDYRAAHRAFTTAVRLHPEHIESALYLQATSYLLGQRDQAFAIFREVVRSGAHDLYLAVTLPGERRFLAEPEVWRVLDHAAQSLSVSILEGTAFGVALGEPRSEVVTRLGAGQANSDAPALTSHAGPETLWMLVFDDLGRLSEVMIDADNLVRYTPFRLRFGGEMDWRASADSMVAALGEPDSRSQTGSEELLTWKGDRHVATLAFAPATEPAPPGLEGTTMLRMVRLARIGSETALTP